MRRNTTARACAGDPSNPQLLALAFFFATSSGDIDDGRPACREGRGDHARRSRRAADTGGRRAEAPRLCRRAQDRSRFRPRVRSRRSPCRCSTAGRRPAWATRPPPWPTSPRCARRTARTRCRMFHLALLSDYLGDNGHGRCVLSHRDERRRDAARGRCLWPLPGAQRAHGRRDSVLHQVRRRIRRAADRRGGPRPDQGGTKPDALVTAPEDGAAEALFGIAVRSDRSDAAPTSRSSICGWRSICGPISIWRVLLADRLESLAEIRRRDRRLSHVDQVSPYYRLAAVEIALDEARLDKNDAAIADLKAADGERSERSSKPGRRWATPIAARQKFAEASDAYDHAIALLSPGAAKDWPIFFARAVSEEGAKNWNAAEVDLKKALQLSPNEPRCPQLSRLQLGRSEPQYSRSAGHAGKGAIAEADRRLHRRQRRLGLFQARPLSPMPPRRWRDAVELVPGDPTINDHLGDALLAGRPQARCAGSSGTTRWPSAPTTTQKSADREEAQGRIGRR